MRSSITKLVFAKMLCCMISPPWASSQSYSEEPIPHPLPDALAAYLFKGTSNSIHIVGLADSITNISFDDTYGFHKLYYVMRNDSSFTSPVALPDTGTYHYGPFEGSGYRFAYDASVTADDGAFIVWSRQQYYWTDVGPPMEFSPRARCVYVASTQVENIFDLQSAKHPRVATSQDGFTHWTWESVVPDPPDTNYLIYVSTVQYRYRTNLGELSSPQEIDRGFRPQILTDENNVVHLLWLKARNSASEYFQLRYANGSSGNFSHAVTLLDSVRTYQDFYAPAPPHVDFSVDSAENVYVAWAEDRAYPNARFFLLTWNGSSVSVDSSALYVARIPHFAFRSNGEIHAVWGFDQLSYSSNVNGPLFSQVRVFQSTMNVGTPHVQLTRSGTPKGIYSDWNSDAINYIRDLENGPDSTFQGPSPGFFLSSLYSVSRPVIIDDQDRTWVSYAKGQYNDFTLWLLKFTDDPNSVEGLEDLPQRFALLQNYPNPFNSITTFSFSLRSSVFAHLSVYDLLGRGVGTLVDEKLGPGRYTRQWDASGVASGVYFYRLRAGDFTETKKLLLLR